MKGFRDRIVQESLQYHGKHMLEQLLRDSQDIEFRKPTILLCFLCFRIFRENVPVSEILRSCFAISHLTAASKKWVVSMYISGCLYFIPFRLLFSFLFFSVFCFSFFLFFVRGRQFLYLLCFC